MEPIQDLEALQGFIDETHDSMQDVETAILELESAPGDADLINTIFRPVHSMKGNSGFFGLTHINKFSHRLEGVLDYIRNGEMVVDSRITNLLLAGLDYLRAMLARVEIDPTSTDMLPEEEEFLEHEIEPCKPESARGSGHSLDTFGQLLEQVMSQGLDIDKDVMLNNTFAELHRASIYLEKWLTGLTVHEETFAPDLAYAFDGQSVATKIQPAGRILQALSQNKPASADTLAAYKDSFPKLQEMLAREPEARDLLEELESTSLFFDDPLLMANREFNANCQQLLKGFIGFFTPPRGEETAPPKLGEILIDNGVINEEDLQEALKLQKGSTPGEKAEQPAKVKNGKTIRIDQSRLDSFANSIGDLYMNLDSFNYLAIRLRQEGIAPDLMAHFSKAMMSLDERVKILQNNVMDIRRIPVKSLFQRFPRVVRELAGSLGKKIEFVMNGQDTVIDKDLLEKIENPLVHLLRNSVDHGIELPDQRQEAGKPETGTLELTAKTDEHSFYLTITDDGKGVDPRRIEEAAIAKGFMPREELDKLSDWEIINLIFRPGFSSASQVSDVSGRGVGLDVVLSALEECGGKIDLQSETGKCTVLRLKIPLTKTLVTSDALIVGSAGQKFAIPSEEITITKYPEDNFINLLSDEGGISFGGQVLRVIDMDHFFFAAPRTKLNKDTQKVLVICQHQGVALLVDQVFTHQIVVVKDFPSGYSHFRNIPGIGGYTCLGNEEVVLVTDVKKMAAESLVH